MKRILYATDCKAHESRALQYAFQLSLVLKANLIVLHIYDLPPIAVSTIRTPEQLQKLAQNEQEENLENYCAKTLQIEAVAKRIHLVASRNEDVTKGILKHVAAFSVDVLIVGMKDEHTSRGLFAGNIANSLLKEISCPLLLVPNDYKYKAIHKIVYAADFEIDDFAAIQELVSIAKPFEASIDVVHVLTVNEDVQAARIQRFKALLEDQFFYGAIRFETINAETIAKGLMSYTKSVRADILAMHERSGPGFLNRLFHRDLVKKMETKVSIPLWCINKKFIARNRDLDELRFTVRKREGFLAAGHPFGVR